MNYLVTFSRRAAEILEKDDTSQSDYMLRAKRQVEQEEREQEERSTH